MDWTWTCNAVTGVCTPSTDLQNLLTLLVQALWTIAGAAVIGPAVIAFCVIFMRRRGG